MAIDSRNKRGSAMQPGLSFGRVLPNPSGAIDSASRQIVAFLYSGILAGAVAVFAFTGMPVGMLVFPNRLMNRF